MKILIVDDDFTSRLLLQKLLACYGECHIAVNGREALDAVRSAIDDGKPYNLICLDIMMPELDGMAVLREIRAMEQTKGIRPANEIKILMTTALGDVNNVITAYQELCNGYLVKPIEHDKLMEELRKLDLI